MLFPLLPGDFEALTSDDHWKKDEILAAKIKKFLSVSYVHAYCHLLAVANESNLKIRFYLDFYVVCQLLMVLHRSR